MGKRVLEPMMVGAGIDRLGLWLRRGQAVVLAYHNVVPDTAHEIGDRSLHVRVSDFAREMDMLCQVGHVVSLRELLSGLEGGDRGRIRFAVTFDDAYRGAVTLGVRELERRGLPATIFVAPSLLGDQTFWWDALYGSTGKGDAPELWCRILTEGKGTLAEATRVATERGLPMKTMPGFARSAEEAELRQAVRVDGITVGSHTWSHASLVRLPGDALREEVGRPRDWLRKRFNDRYMDLLAYPYGFHSAAVRNATRDAGYQAGFALTPGTLPVTNVPHSTREAFGLPRLNVPAGLSLNGLRLRSAWC